MYPLKSEGILDQDTGPPSILNISEDERPVVSQDPTSFKGLCSNVPEKKVKSASTHSSSLSLTENM